MQHIQPFHSTALLLLAGLPFAPVDDPTPEGQLKAPEFHDPVRLKAGSDFVRTAAPGYATPAWYDASGDGRPDLVVGQFDGGKIQVFPSRDDGSFDGGKWLQAGGEVAKVPGVW